MSPIQFQNSYPSRSNVVRSLIIINVIVFLGGLFMFNSSGFDINRFAGLYNFRSDHFRPFQLVSHMFLHGSFMHIFFNMFALYIFGSALERVWGPGRFLTYYFVTGLGAALLHLTVSNYLVSGAYNDLQAYLAKPDYAAFEAYSDKYYPGARQDSQINRFMIAWDKQPESQMFVAQSIDLANEIFQLRLNIPTVGASGAVFGVLLAFGMLFPNTVLLLIFPPIPIKAKYLVIIYGLLELFLGLKNSVDDNVAHFAHLGGMLFGFLLIKFWQKNIRNQLY